jgi:hypothetical protein
VRNIDASCGRSRLLPESDKGYFFLRPRVFFATLRDAAADLSIRKSSRFLPALMAAVSQRGCAPRPAQVFPSLSRYFAATFLPLVARPCFLRPLPISPPPVSRDSCGLPGFFGPRLA